jgi:hypothetical protein
MIHIFSLVQSLSSNVEQKNAKEDGIRILEQSLQDSMLT